MFEMTTQHAIVYESKDSFPLSRGSRAFKTRHLCETCYPHPGTQDTRRERRVTKAARSAHHAQAAQYILYTIYNILHVMLCVDIIEMLLGPWIIH